VSASIAITGDVVLQPRDNAGLRAFISQVSNKYSAQYHHYLAPGAFAGRFGPLPSTIATVKSQLQAEGLKVRATARDGLLLSFTGSAKDVEAAFHTGLGRYRLADGTTGRATTSSVQLPAAIAGSVAAVVGLNDLVHAHPAIIRHGSGAAAGKPAVTRAAIAPVAGGPAACFDATTAATSLGGLTDDQIANAYGAFGLYQKGDTGAGQHIAIYELEPFLPSDVLKTFHPCYFGAAAATTMGGRLAIIPVDGGQQFGPGGGEATLDVEDVSAMAPGANLDVYEAPNNTAGGIDEYATIINDDVDRIVTTSWGLCEAAIQQGSPGLQQAENLLFEQAAAQGQSVFAAAGDTGSNDCNFFRASQPVSPILSVNDPASQPYVVAVGGTTIDNANQPPSEHAWNDGAVWGAGGGGISESWPMPTWQLLPSAATAALIARADQVEAGDVHNPSFCPSDVSSGATQIACREVPDVSAQADEFTGAVTVYSAAFGAGPAGWITIGGTSSATPIWAALLALVNGSNYAATPCTSSSSSPGGGVGFVAPLLYSVASNSTQYRQSFNDILAGNNDPYGFSGLFPATPGYDMATGLGSPQLTSPPTVTNPTGRGLAFNLCTAARSSTRPVVSGLFPSVVPTAGGVKVTISGAGFASGGTSDVASVQIGTYHLSAFSVDNAGSITVTVPRAASLQPPGDTTDGAGGYQVQVTLTSGETSLPSSQASLLEYVDQASKQTIPTVTSVRTFVGPETGGNSLEIFGSGFLGATAVTFGGLPASPFSVVSDSIIETTAPGLGPTPACVQDGSFFSTRENFTNDICQVHVVVTNPQGSSHPSTILPMYEGPGFGVAANSNGAIVAPPGQEVAPQPDEYDYLPDPTITSISTSNGPASLASELGGTVVTITGRGFNLIGLDNVNFGDPTQEATQDGLWLTVTGTQIQLVAPGISPLTFGPLALPVNVTTAAGLSAASFVKYAGLPVVQGVVATGGPTALRTTAEGLPGGPDTGGTPITLSGSDFSQATVVEFSDILTPFSVGTQYHFTVVNDETLTALTVAQNPDTVDIVACSVTACLFTPSAPEFVLFPPGAPFAQFTSDPSTGKTPASGPATGGTAVNITGANLGCATGVSFGAIPAQVFGNPSAVLGCGQTSMVQVIAPPLPLSTSLPKTVPVRVTTAESDLTGETPTTTATFTYEPVAPVFTADSPPRTGKTGVWYGPYRFRASGDPPSTFSVTAGALPPGLILNRSTGVLAGRPTKLGLYSFKVTASNGAAPAAISPPITITIRAAPVFTADTPPPSARLGARYSYLFGASGLPAPTFSVSAGTLPAGLTLNHTTGLLSGRPTKRGVFSFRLTARNDISPAAVTPTRSINVS
jgi:hypothetical protein